MHKIASSDQNFRGHCFAYLLNLLSTLLRRSGNFHEKSENFVLNFLWQPCLICTVGGMHPGN